MHRWLAFLTIGAVVSLEPTAFAEEAPPAPPTSPPQTPAGGTPGYNEPLSTPQPLPSDHATVDNSPSAHDGKPLAGYHNGLFFLRDHHDNFHLYIQGRAQIDWYSYVGAGVPDTALKPTLFLRRVRPEISGEFLGH